ncbi:MAG: pyridoxal phosphate-dependent aminotransferase, partial [Rhizomicrobium sp.]
MTDEGRDDLLSRGYSRRQMMRAAMLVGGGATALAFNPEIAKAAGAAKSDMIRINLNECWAGPMAPGLKASAEISAKCNRYTPDDIHARLIKTISGIENMPEDHISTWPGSNEALARSVLVFCSPTKGLVTADPSYETAVTAAKFLGAPIKGVPLTDDYRHDVKAMLAANPDAGLYYICTPNNPTGTITPLADIEWLIANKPAGSMVLIDEAYTHFAGVPVASYLAVKHKDVIVMRTFSKIFGMAGMRMGYIMARPDIIAKMMRYDGGMQSGALPLPSLACATASLTAAPLIAARRVQMQTARGLTLDHLKARGLKVVPTNANMFMIDWKTKPAKDMQAAFRAQSIEIGRSWPIWPTVSRVTVGSVAEM